MAQEMGARLGQRHLLQRSLPRRIATPGKELGDVGFASAMRQFGGLFTFVSYRCTTRG